MLKNDISIEIIKKITNLSEEEIEKISKMTEEDKK
jgi:hypothetical protein